MREELKKIADVLYVKILGPGSTINIGWIYKTLKNLDIPDESLEKLYEMNAPLSREVWYYAFIRTYEERKLDYFLNSLSEHLDLGILQNFKNDLSALGIYYKNGVFKRRVFKLVVLVSGRGTNLQAIMDAIDSGKLNVQISAVISNKKNAYALKRAENKGIDAIVLTKKKGEKRESYDRRLAEVIDFYSPDLIVLAGFLRILSPWFVKKYKNKIINIHPALLPSFAGLYGENVHKAVLDYGCKVSGCTVHFVDEEVDHGPIIVQKCVEVLDDDTPESLAARVLEKEHEALVESIKLISEGKIEIRDRRVLRKII